MDVHTPYRSDKEGSHNIGIFHSLGLSRKLDLIHQETDHVVREMMQNGNSVDLSNKPGKNNQG